jgi:hypothetical protein
MRTVFESLHDGTREEATGGIFNIGSAMIRWPRTIAGAMALRCGSLQLGGRLILSKGSS